MVRRTLVVLALLLLPAAAHGQGTPNPNEAGFEQPAAEGESSGTDPLYGYLGFAALAGLGLFIVCKSARR